MKLTLTHGFAALAVASLLLGAADTASAQAASMAGCSDDLRHNATREQAEFVSDGRTIRGLLYKPRTSNGAAVVLLHGFRGLSADAPMFDPHAIQLATRGYTVLVPNYFDSRPYRDRRNGLDMRTWAKTATNAVQYAGTLEGVNPQKVAVWGFSLGGFLATDASVAPESSAAMAIGVGAGTGIWAEMTRERREIPILMIHGRADPVVTPSSMRTLAADLRRRGATVDVELIDANEHVLEGPIWCDVFQMSRRFLDAHLLAAPAG